MESMEGMKRTEGIKRTEHKEDMKSMEGAVEEGMTMGSISTMRRSKKSLRMLEGRRMLTSMSIVWRISNE
jgi:hypothetical protein